MTGDPDGRPEGRLPRPASALRQALAEGYSWALFRQDAMAGLVVGIVALPLSMALAIASGVDPQQGLYTAIVAGFLIALLGGSRTQVSGPTAAFVVILLPITAKFGLGGLALASAMAGGILVVLALCRMGRLVQFVPFPVTTGFTAGIAVVIAIGQVKDFLGLQFAQPEHFHERVLAIASHLGSVHGSDCAVGGCTLLLLVLLPRWLPRIPAPLLAVGGTAALGWLLHRVWPAFDVATIENRFHYQDHGVTTGGVPPWPPLPVLPWNLPGPSGAPLGLSWTTLKELFPSSLAIAALGAIESLLSATAADAMAGTRSDPDAELLAQGVGNLTAPFFGGFAATGAIARTATNIRAGARTPVAAMVHALFLLLAVLCCAPLLGHLPMAAMAALLLMVAWRMSDVRHFGHVLRTAPRADIAVLLACFGLTVAFDMVVGVTAGMVLASLLFMRRMAEMTGTSLVREGHPELRGPVPPGVLVYEVEGPMFFGAAEKAMTALHSIGRHRGAVVLDLDGVPAIDATGLVNLGSVLARLRSDRIPVVMTGVRPKVRETLARAHLDADEEHRFLARTMQQGVERAATLLRGPAPRA